MWKGTYTHTHTDKYSYNEHTLSISKVASLSISFPHYAPIALEKISRHYSLLCRCKTHIHKSYIEWCVEILPSVIIQSAINLQASSTQHSQHYMHYKMFNNDSWETLRSLLHLDIIELTILYTSQLRLLITGICGKFVTVWKKLHENNTQADLTIHKPSIHYTCLWDYSSASLMQKWLIQTHRDMKVSKSLKWQSLKKKSYYSFHFILAKITYCQKGVCGEKIIHRKKCQMNFPSFPI